MTSYGRWRVCRRCNQTTHDYDRETDTWFCGYCDMEADV